MAAPVLADAHPGYRCLDDLATAVAHHPKNFRQMRERLVTRTQATTCSLLRTVCAALSLIVANEMFKLPNSSSIRSANDQRAHGCSKEDGEYETEYPQGTERILNTI
jgi:hypothetical protein